MQVSLLDSAISTVTNMAKGNDGKGARRRATKQLLFVAGCVLVFVVGFLCLSDRQGEADASRDGRGLRDSKRRQDRRPRRGRGAADADEGIDPHEREVRYRRYLIDQFESPEEELELLEEVLNGKLHLIDIEVVEKELERAPKGSYAGVYGNFCRVNFAVHKANPSIGTSRSREIAIFTLKETSNFNCLGHITSRFVSPFSC